ncbi:alpha/beta hydrolase [Erwinia sp. OLTSP20]|uniref:alpha/beta fold hydrolase n=1 Tax=unclassified Erwinia TaxID=2622719 RepID=UPI000C17C8D0|nr:MULTISPECIES: alpha/beta fold hydrolase [unclassified Erwinia]PIJ48855.1 alpha/beta hydrolase [Erwinia sp. OAMSP11]PIJ69477.1 alpha/beta hydrolase [Erwinia sp. OLSSP12]PIJ79311.1 alpha/beta hydrolase [Erwinia sp. OLCASP19]PIJ80837.1 alpha/beta hydrolase [Erwinia sp. OLMTSP26]PIJ82988.1 alpha/beta hydrolase [Erwinia sp. OLMDSP33]
MNLNVRLLTNQSDAAPRPLLLIHGLFGNLDNLGVLARDLQHQRQIVLVDVRNHGHSACADEMSYRAMAGDLIDTLDQLHIAEVDVIGHSMGGKIAMALTALAPQRVGQLAVLDIAPVAYQQRHHDAIFAALRAVTEAGITSRSDASTLMRGFVEEEGVIQFLLKSFDRGQWRFNVDALWRNYPTLIGWQPVPAWHGPALFIRGDRSAYLSDDYRDTLLSQFPAARAHVIAGAGHWLHAEKPQAVLRALRRFFAL